MPGFDGTGPRGMGCMMGGGRGFCGDPGAARRPLAGGRGRRNQYHATDFPRWQRCGFWNAPASAGDEKLALKGEADALRARLEGLEKRLAALNAEGK